MVDGAASFEADQVRASGDVRSQCGRIDPDLRQVLPRARDLLPGERQAVFGAYLPDVVRADPSPGPRIFGVSLHIVGPTVDAGEQEVLVGIVRRRFGLIAQEGLEISALLLLLLLRLHLHLLQ